MSGRGPYAKGAARREQILQAAMSVIADGGYERIGLRKLAREIGVDPAHIIYYFGSREGLLMAIIDRWDEETLDTAESRDSVHDLDFLVEHVRRDQAISGIVHLYLHFAAESVDAGHPAHDFFARRFTATKALLVQSIRVEQENGTLPAELDPEREARQLIAVSDGLQLQALVDSAVDAAGDLQAFIDRLRSPGRGTTG